MTIDDKPPSIAIALSKRCLSAIEGGLLYYKEHVMKINSKSPKNKKLIMVGLSLVIIFFFFGSLVNSLEEFAVEYQAGKTRLVNVTQPKMFVEKYRFTGNGKGTTGAFRLPDGIMKVSWQYTGNSNFIIHLWDLSTTRVEHVANSISSVKASALVPVSSKSDYIFEILEGTGTWEIIVEYRP